MAKKKYYAVRKGRERGIFTDWETCKAQVQGFPGADFKGFVSLEEAQAYLGKTQDPGPKDLGEGDLVAYVDGSYNQADQSYAYGVLLIHPQGQEETYSQRFNREDMREMRNVAGELEGAKLAMARARDLGAKTLYLHYDYLGIEKWALGEWKRNKKGTQDYKAYYDQIKEDLKVVFIKVPAHSGVEGNERADLLAKEAKF
ncbi:MAG: ribonuclease H family protein [Tissierellia bacterium]|nr:ribonuclease H family protein [Tissierellia bacterium]